MPVLYPLVNDCVLYCFFLSIAIRYMYYKVTRKSISKYLNLPCLKVLFSFVLSFSLSFLLSISSSTFSFIKILINMLSICDLPYDSLSFSKSLKTSHTWRLIMSMRKFGLRLRQSSWPTFSCELSAFSCSRNSWGGRRARPLLGFEKRIF